MEKKRPTTRNSPGCVEVSSSRGQKRGFNPTRLEVFLSLETEVLFPREHKKR